MKTATFWNFDEIENLPKIKPKIETDYAQPQKGR